jgi:hypothetical protein
MTSDANRKLWPIVVGGCHRSGTTLLRYVLDSHSHIYCGPELTFFPDFFEDWPNDPYQNLRFFHVARTILPEDEIFQIMGRAFLEMHERAARKNRKARWANKAPSNALWLPKWEQLLGTEWLYIHVLRNPLDTLASVKDHPMPRTIPASLEGRIAHYRRYVEAGLSWIDSHPCRGRLLLYENFVRQPENTCAALMAWVGESFEPSQIQFALHPHAAGLEDPEIRSTPDIHTRSVGAWRHKLTAPEANTIWVQLGPLWSKASGIAGADYLP